MDYQVPTSQTAAEIHNPSPNAKIVIRHDVAVAAPGPDEVLIKLHFSGICHSDIRAYLGWGAYEAIVGHEGVGTVVKVGCNVDPSVLGQRVGIKWLHSACDDCSACSKGFPNNCCRQNNTGRNVPGTLQQFAVANARHMTKIPPGLPGEIAAPLLCAGLTMAGAISKLEGDLEAGDWVVISGSGGGLGHMGVQIASLKGFRVIAVDSGEGKRSLSLDSGAEVFIDYKTMDVEKEVKALTGEGASAVVVVPGSEEAFNLAPKLVRNMGVIVCVGLPRNDFNLPISATMCSARGLVIKGVSVGTEEQMDQLLQQALEGKLRPLVEVFDFEQVSNVFDRLRDDGVTGRAVVRIPQ